MSNKPRIQFITPPATGEKQECSYLFPVPNNTQQQAEIVLSENNQTIAGNKTFTGTTTFQGAVVGSSSTFANSAGGTAASLAHYEEAVPVVLAITGPFAATNVTFTFWRIGKLVIMKVPTISIACTVSSQKQITTVAGSSIPARFRPASQHRGYMSGSDSGANVAETMTMDVFTNGTVTIYRDLNSTNSWTSGAGTCGCYGFYTIYATA